MKETVLCWPTGISKLMVKHCNTLMTTLFPFVFNVETTVYIRSLRTLDTDTQLLATTLIPQHTCA